MKKNWKSVLSLLFVLVFMLQIAGVTASADYDPSVTGDEPLSLVVYIPVTDENGNTYSARMDGEAVNLPEGKSLSVSLGGSEMSIWSAVRLADLMNSDVVITPPEGYYVAEAYLAAGDLNGQTPATLEGEAEYPSLTGTRVTLKKENFADEENPGYFDSSRLSNLGGSYMLVLRLELLEDIHYVTVSYSSGDVYANVPPAESGDIGTSFTVQPMFESVPGKLFQGWQLTYGSGSVVDVATGSQIQPYADCTLVAQWEDEEAPAPVEPEPAPVEPEPVPVDPAPVEPTVHEHEWVESSVVPATCETDGVRYLTCATCNEATSEVIPATGHSYVDSVVAPTYEAEGYTEHVCSVCGASYRDNYTPKLEHVHSYTEQITKAATCTEAGVKTFTCECGDSYTEEIPAIGHSYSEAVTKEATCTEPGVKTFTCANCGDSYTQEIPVKDHDYDVITIEPSVSAEGYTLHKCKVCGYEYRDNYTPKKEMQILPAPSFSASTWTRGSNSSVTLTVNYDYSKFVDVLLDGVKLTRDMDYSVREGSTVVEMNAGTLEKFTAGEREIKVLFTDAESTGKLTIAEAPAPEKVSLTIKAKDRTAEYTGQNITCSEYEIVSGKLNDGDSIQVEYSGGSVNVTNGATGSISRVVITDRSGKDVTSSGYNVTVQNGTVVVTRRPLNINGQNVTKTYDGNAYSLANDYASKISSDKLNGHSISVNLDIYQNGSRVSEARNGGSYDIMLSAFTVKDSSGVDVSGNYSFTGTLPHKLGTLSIQGNPAAMTPVTVTAKSQTWTYDGAAHSANEYTLSTSLLDGDTISVSFDPSSSITNVGSVANKISTVTIKDRNGSAVAFALNGQGSGKYDVRLADGTLKVDPFKLTLTAVSAEKYYDGTALKNDNVKATALISGHRFSVVRFAVTDSQGNLIKNGPVSVGTYTKKVTDVTILDSKGSDVTKNYDISKVDGTLKVLQSDGNNNSKSPRTGDENNIGLWVGLLAASAVIVLGIVGYFYFRNKKGAAKARAKSERSTQGKH